MRRARWAVVALAWLVVLVVSADERPAEACGWTWSVEVTTSRHPDLPTTHFAAGHLGVLKSSYARSYLVVAYRILEGIGLDPIERRGALSLWKERMSMDESASSSDTQW